MFHFLGNVVATILTTYLSLVGGLADNIRHTFSGPPPTQVLERETAGPEDKATLSSLPSHYEYGGQLPDILIRNAAYQRAAVIESTSLDAAATGSPNFEAIVNVYCTYTTAEYQRTTAGSGFFVSDKGVILTNAHVAQFLLLEDLEGYGETECVIRTGEVATPAYLVDLLYISPAWIQENAATISAAKPQGTGERDYALLYITEGVDAQAVPAKLPYLQANTDLLPVNTRGKTAIIGGYPAASLLAEGPTSLLTRETATTTIADLFTFGSNYADIVFLSGTSIGEHGVSGGPVLSEEGDVIGLISTRSNDDELGVGSLNAITLSYIHRTMLEETGFGFLENINGNLPFRAEIFKATIVPFLSQMLAEEL